MVLLQYISLDSPNIHMHVDVTHHCKSSDCLAKRFAEASLLLSLIHLRHLLHRRLHLRNMLHPSSERQAGAAEPSPTSHLDAFASYTTS